MRDLGRRPKPWCIGSGSLRMNSILQHVEANFQQSFHTAAEVCIIFEQGNVLADAIPSQIPSIEVKASDNTAGYLVTVIRFSTSGATWMVNLARGPAFNDTISECLDSPFSCKATSLLYSFRIILNLVVDLRSV